MDNQSKAVVIKTFTHGDVELRLTEKGAVTVYRKDMNGSLKFQFANKPSDVTLHAELGSTAYQQIIESVEWANIQENKEKNKALNYANKQLAKALDRRAQEIQAAVDKLKAMGVDPSALLAKTKAS